MNLDNHNKIAEIVSKFQKDYIVINESWDLDTIVNNYFGVDYFNICLQENRGQNSYIKVDVTKVDSSEHGDRYLDYKNAQIQQLKNGEGGDIEVLMNEMAENGVIPYGEYLILCWW